MNKINNEILNENTNVNRELVNLYVFGNDKCDNFFNGLFCWIPSRANKFDKSGVLLTENNIVEHIFGIEYEMICRMNNENSYDVILLMNIINLLYPTPDRTLACTPDSTRQSTSTFNGNVIEEPAIDIGSCDNNNEYLIIKFKVTSNVCLYEYKIWNGMYDIFILVYSLFIIYIFE